MRGAARDAAIELHEGVYMWFNGPSFETPAEIRAAKNLGADLVGMSTVPEVILARCAGLSASPSRVVTNFAAGLVGRRPQPRGDAGIRARAARERFRKLLRAFIAAHERGAMMLPQEIIRAKRDGRALAPTEIDAFIAGLTSARSARARPPPSPWRCSFAA